MIITLANQKKTMRFYKLLSSIWTISLITTWGYLAFQNEEHAYSPIKTGIYGAALIAGPLILILFSIYLFKDNKSNWQIISVSCTLVCSSLLLLFLRSEIDFGWVLYLAALPLHLFGSFVIFLIVMIMNEKK